VRLEGAIVILDEAHNIEDVCRDAASFSVDDYEVGEAIRDLIEKRKELERKYKWVTSKTLLGTLDSELDLLDKRIKVEQDDIDIDIEDFYGNRDKDKGGDRRGAIRQVYENLEYVGHTSMLHLFIMTLEYVSFRSKTSCTRSNFSSILRGLDWRSRQIGGRALRRPGASEMMARTKVS